MVLPSVEPELTVTDPRDAKILLLEVALSSFQSRVDKSKSTAGAASMQHQPHAPMYSTNHNSHHDVVVKPESFLCRIMEQICEFQINLQVISH